MNVLNKIFLIFHIVLFSTSIYSQSCFESTPDIESLRNLYCKKMIERAQRDEKTETPDWVKQLPEKFATLLNERHLYKEGPVWGLAKRDPQSKLFYDEGGSLYFLRLATMYNLWNRMPPLDENKRKEALTFWKSWQNPISGIFYDPKHPERMVNEKYIKALIDWFGGKPLYPSKTSQQAISYDENGKINTTIFLNRTKNDPDWEKGGWGVGSHTGKMAKELWYKVNEGHTGLIPDLKLGIEQILSHQDPGSGLWGPPQADLTGRIGGTLKIISRFYHGMGIKVPYSQEMTNSIIEYSQNGTWESLSSFCVPVNVVTTISYLLETSDYRKEELYNVMESILEGIRNNWFTHDGIPLTSYRDLNSIGIEYTIINAIGIIGGYLNWQNCPIKNDLLDSPFNQRGFGYRYLANVDEHGNVTVNDINQIHIPYSEHLDF